MKHPVLLSCWTHLAANHTSQIACRTTTTANWLLILVIVMLISLAFTGRRLA